MPTTLEEVVQSLLQLEHRARRVDHLWTRPPFPVHVVTLVLRRSRVSGYGSPVFLLREGLWGQGQVSVGVGCDSGNPWGMVCRHVTVVRKPFPERVGLLPIFPKVHDPKEWGE